MKSGKLIHRVTIQTKSTTKDSYGAELDTWSDVATVWASIEPLSTRERIAAQQVNAELTHKIIMRYRSGITAANRIEFGTRYFDIEPPQNAGERNVELVILAKENV